MAAWSIVVGATFRLACAAVSFGCDGPDASGIDGGTDARNDAHGHDAPPTATRIDGLLGGSPFTLGWAVVIFESPLSTLCVSNTPISAPDCGYTDQQSKTLLYGRFGFDDANQPRWAFPVELRRVPNGPVELASEGTLTLDEYAPEMARAAGSVTLTFNSGVTSGTFSVP